MTTDTIERPENITRLIISRAIGIIFYGLFSIIIGLFLYQTFTDDWGIFKWAGFLLSGLMILFGFYLILKAIIIICNTINTEKNK